MARIDEKPAKAPVRPAARCSFRREVFMHPLSLGDLITSKKDERANEATFALQAFRESEPNTGSVGEAVVEILVS